MPYLSRDQLEKIAERVVCQYKKIYVPERRMCYMVDATELAEMLGFKIEYVNITRDGSILGQTSSGMSGRQMLLLQLYFSRPMHYWTVCSCSAWEIK